MQNKVIDVTHSDGTINQIYDEGENEKVKIAVVLGEIDESLAKVLIYIGSDVNTITCSFYNKISNNHKIELKHKAYFKLASNQIVSTNYVVNLKLKFINLEINEMFWMMKICAMILYLAVVPKKNTDYISIRMMMVYTRNMILVPAALPFPFIIKKNWIIFQKFHFNENLSDYVKKELHPKLRRLINKFSDVLILLIMLKLPMLNLILSILATIILLNLGL